MTTTHSAMVSRTRWRGVALIGLWLLSATAGATAASACPGDCNGDGQVTIDELLTLVNIALGNAPVSTCPFGA